MKEKKKKEEKREKDEEKGGVMRWEEENMQKTQLLIVNLQVETFGGELRQKALKDGAN